MPVEQRDTRIDSRDAKALTTLFYFWYDIVACLIILEWRKAYISLLNDVDNSSRNKSFYFDMQIDIYFNIVAYFMIGILD